jgi:hypothetical protein
MGTSLDSGGIDTLVTAKDVTAEADDDRFLADHVVEDFPPASRTALNG